MDSNKHKRRGNTFEYNRMDSFGFATQIRWLSENSTRFAKSSMCWEDGFRIKYVFCQDYVNVMYKIKMGIKIPIKYTIHFETVPNNYGGRKRVYFSCPKCGRRSRFVYLIELCFICRICAELNYESQQRTKNELLAAENLFWYIRGKFQDMSEIPLQTISEYVPSRPKGMHQTTYNRRLEELIKLQRGYARQWG